MSRDPAVASIEPFYFGAPDRLLFGCYHPPRAAPARDTAAVLCYPMGEEYVRFHRAFRQLALQLAAAGFPVLRFDFYGCGDSGGEATEWHLAQWQADLATAIAEVQRRCGPVPIALAGLRLGATLAATIATTHGEVAAAALWDPVLNGQAHLEELRALHASMLRRAHVLPRPPDGTLPAAPHVPPAEPGRDSAPPQEILGFPLTAALRADIAAIDLLTLAHKPAPQVLLVESNAASGQAAFARRLQQMGASVEHRVVPSPRLWVWEEGVGKVVVPQPILQAIASWIAGICP